MDLHELLPEKTPPTNGLALLRARLEQAETRSRFTLTLPGFAVAAGVLIFIIFMAPKLMNESAPTTFPLQASANTLALGLAVPEKASPPGAPSHFVVPFFESDDLVWYQVVTLSEGDLHKTMPDKYPRGEGRAGPELRK